MQAAGSPDDSDPTRIISGVLGESPLVHWSRCRVSSESFTRPSSKSAVAVDRNVSHHTLILVTTIHTDLNCSPEPLTREALHDNYGQHSNAMPQIGGLWAAKQRQPERGWVGTLGTALLRHSGEL